jgi:hypothetical protein
MTESSRSRSQLVNREDVIFLITHQRSALLEAAERDGMKPHHAEVLRDMASWWGDLAEAVKKLSDRSVTRSETKESAAPEAEVGRTPQGEVTTGAPVAAPFSSDKPSQPSAYLFNGHAFTPNLLTSDQRARAVPLYALPSATPRGSGLYVASRVKQAEVWKAYRARGWKINASWIDEAGEGETADFGELWDRIRGEIARSYALVFYAAGVDDFPVKGALVEVGMALAMGKPVIAALENVMLDGRTMRPVGSWLLDRNVVRCDTLEEAMDIARGGDRLRAAMSSATESRAKE